MTMADERLQDLDVMRKRWCGSPSPGIGFGKPMAPDEAAAVIDSMRGDGSWADVDYHRNDLKDWSAVVHLQRLWGLARAWHEAPGPGLLAPILRGLEAWYERDPINPNWWWNQIGAPSLLGEILLYVKGACEDSYIARAVPAFVRHEPIDRFTGQNLVWTATVMIYQGILTDAPDRVSRAFVRIGHETRTLPGEEGIQPDGSFFQHGLLLYSGGYGKNFAADVARLIALSEGTAYAWSRDKVDRFARWMLNGSRWMIRGEVFDPGTIGREISRQGHGAGAFFNGLRLMATVPHSRQGETVSSAAVDPASGQSMVRGNRYFWCADLMVQHRAAYYCSVRVPSSRVFNNDMACCGGEGRVCHHMADGATFLMRDGEEYRDIYAVWNWRQIPGTTVVQATGDLDPDGLRVRGEKAFAGGASDGEVGCMAVDFARPGLTARKAWFLFEDSVVALGAGIRSNAGAPVRTTINQCRWRGSVRMTGKEGELTEGEVALGPGSCFIHDGMGYHVLEGEGTLRLGDQEGAWSECGVGSPEPCREAVLNAGLDHGIDPTDGRYGYAVRLGLYPEETVVDTPVPWVVVANDRSLQAVWHSGEQRGHAVFYEPGEVSFPDGQRVGVDTPCVVLYREVEGVAVLTLAQPEQREGKVRVSLAGRNQGYLAVTWPTATQGGSSLTVELKSETPGQAGGAETVASVQPESSPVLGCGRNATGRDRK